MPPTVLLADDGKCKIEFEHGGATVSFKTEDGGWKAWRDGACDSLQDGAVAIE